MAKNQVVAVTVRIQPGISWQELHVDGILVANVWGRVTNISHNGSGLLVSIGEDLTNAFFHVDEMEVDEVKA